jgi:putative alpha-1,2-mannosidase
LFHLKVFSHALNEKDGCKDSEVVISNNEIFGFSISTGSLSRRIGGAKIYFYAKFNKNFQQFGVWEVDKILPGQRRMKGNNIGSYFEFEDQEVEFQLAISFQVLLLN